MELSTIQKLAAWPPPPAGPKKYHFKSAREAHQQISVLEGILGIAPSKPSFDIREFNARFQVLEELRQKRSTMFAAPAADLPAAMPAPTVAALPSAIQSDEVKKLKSLSAAATGATKRCYESKIAKLEARR